ncbi:MAG: uroporphyrinogen-III synthase, partial [Flavobacteriaceae bacterium]
MHKPVIVSTKLLPVALRDRIVQNGFGYVEYNAIRITPVAFEMPNPTDYVIFSSQNATKIVLENPHILQQSKLLCVGKQSEKLLIEKDIKPLKMTQNMSELVGFIEKLPENASFLHFCGNRRLPLLATKMSAWQRNFFEVM